MSNKVLKDIIKTREVLKAKLRNIKLNQIEKSGRVGKRIFHNTPLPAAESTNVVHDRQDSPYVDSVGNQEEEEEVDFRSAEEDMNIDESSSGNTPLLNNSKNKKRFRIKRSLKRNIEKKGLKIEKNLKALNHLKREKKENAFQRRKATTTTTPITFEQKKILKRKNSTPLDGFDDNNVKRSKTSHIYFNQKRKSESQLKTDKKRNKNYNNSKLKTNLVKTLGISIDSNSKDFHKKRLCNLIAPTDPKDAVTKAYLLRKNDVLTDRVTTTCTSKLNRIEDDMRQFQNSYDSQMNSMKKQIDELYTTIKNDINSEAKQVEITLKNQLINANKPYMNKIEERFDKIEEYIF
uniref:Uncharacterized protein n=1 Tax=Glossina palpalis gambiensis TaxID=67801 RepID=A0A1B0B252_9MUSC